MEEATSAEHCRNCGASLSGPFCHECGQSARVVRRHARDLVEEVLGNTLQWDSRLLRTLKLLFTRPGQLALDWIEGKRARYVPPFRLYIVASFIMFLLLNLATRGTGLESETVQVSSNSVEAVRQSLEEAQANGEWLDELLLQGTLQVIEDPEGYQKRVLSNLPNAAFLLLPVFAGLHLLVNLRRERFYIDHLVFSLHFHAFAFLVLSLVLLAGLLSRALGNWPDLLNLVIPVYLVMAFRTFNQQGWGKSLLKSALVFGAYFLVLIFGVALYMSLILVI